MAERKNRTDRQTDLVFLLVKIYLFLHFLFFMLEIVLYFLPVGEIYLESLCYYNT